MRDGWIGMVVVILPGLRVLRDVEGLLRRRSVDVINGHLGMRRERAQDLPRAHLCASQLPQIASELGKAVDVRWCATGCLRRTPCVRAGQKRGRLRKPPPNGRAVCSRRSVEPLRRRDETRRVGGCLPQQRFRRVLEDHTPERVCLVEVKIAVTGAIWRDRASCGVPHATPVLGVAIAPRVDQRGESVPAVRRRLGRAERFYNPS